MSFRFVHTADVHLDSPLRSLALRNPDLAALISNATRRTFVAIIDLCLSEQVDALLIAGDLYDGDQTSMKTARFLAEQLRRLEAAGIKTFIIRGNHDALSKITKELVLPGTVKVFGGRAETVVVRDEPGYVPVAIHGLSFAQPRAPEGLLPRFKQPVAGALNIGLMHTSLGGAPGHDVYAPCSPTELDQAGFHYWALGHIHKRSVTGAKGSIVMPGIPQGRDINEDGPKSVSLVVISNDGNVEVEERVLAVTQFERVAVDATDAEDWTDLIGRIARALDRARAAAVAEHLVVRLRITGGTPLAWQIRRDVDLLKAEAEMRASILGNTWIEKLEITCAALMPAPAPSLQDPLSELRGLVVSEILPGPAFSRAMAAIADELRTQLPPECRAIFGQDEASSTDLISRLAEEGAQDVLARLHAGNSGEDR